MAKDLVGIDESGFEHGVFLDTDPSLAANSNEKVASQKAVKQYVDDNAGGAVPVKATGAELVTGTDDAKFATAKSLADALVVRGVKRYVALLTQTGTDAPIATVLENTLGGTVVWTRFGQGEYIGTLVGAFPDISKLVLFTSQNDNGYQFEFVGDNSADAVILRCYRIIYDDGISGELTDGVFAYRSIEIRVYP